MFSYQDLIGPAGGIIGCVFVWKAYQSAMKDLRKDLLQCQEGHKETSETIGVLMKQINTLIEEGGFMRGQLTILKDLGAQRHIEVSAMVKSFVQAMVECNVLQTERRIQSEAQEEHK